MDLLRFITAGSVDDGKSTLIGRLLYDSKNILTDQLETLRRQSRNVQYADIDLALLTDGLRAEREQGITIDVAYKYFATPKRKFIIADAPGHIQYTRNMITGASNSDCIVILIDARKGVIEQTRRHSIIASLLRISQVIVAVNKMDLVQYDKAVYDKIIADYQELAAGLGLHNVYYLPISALKGENIIEGSVNFSWFSGSPLLPFLEAVPVQTITTTGPLRFNVQYVIRPQSEALHDYRGYAGRIASGVVTVGDAVQILPSGVATTIKAIEVAGKEKSTACAGQSVVLHLSDNVDVSRGDSIVTTDALPQIKAEFEVLLCWMNTEDLQPGTRFTLQQASRRVKAIIKNIEYKLDVNTLQKHPAPSEVKLNDVVKATIKTAEPLAFDAFEKSTATGAAILIDPTSHQTVGAVMIQG